MNLTYDFKSGALDYRPCSFTLFFLLHLLSSLQHLLRLASLAVGRCCWQGDCLQMMQLIKSTHLFVQNLIRM